MGGGIGDQTTILARGSAFQATLISSIAHSETELREASSREAKMNESECNYPYSLITRRREEEGKEVELLEGTWIAVIQKERALLEESFFSRCRAASTRIAFEVWEVKEGIREEKIIPPKSDEDRTK